TKCFFMHAFPACINGGCTIDTCYPNFGNCDNDLMNGCETMVNTDPMNCGACGTICSNNNISNPTCQNNTCNGTCNTGFADCNMNKQMDGCEVNTGSDPSNCGACGLSCDKLCIGNVMPGGLTCSNGGCAVSGGGCAAGFYDLNGVCGDG